MMLSRFTAFRRNPAVGLALIAAIVTFVFHAIANPHYGFFRDELYFIICGRHPAFGYVDQPPLVPLIAAGSQLFGISLVALRATAALFAAAGVFVSCRLTAEWGGNRFAQIFTAIVVALTPVLTAFGEKVGPDMVGLWLWPLAALYVARLINGADPRWWLAVGAAIGVSGEAKYSVAFFCAALLVGLLISPSRRVLRTPWLLAGIGLGALIVLPNAAWQAAHGFPMWQLLRNAQLTGKNVVLSPAAFAAQQLLLTNPLLAPVWIIGLVRAFADARLRWAGWTYVLLVAMMIALHGKNYYPAEVYPMMIAIGALTIGEWTARLPVLQPAIAVLALIFAAWMIPFVEPILSEQQIAGYTAALHVNASSEHHMASPIGQDFADMHGWPQLTALVAKVYDSLPPPQRSQAAIFATNYGEASAISFFGGKYGLPPALSGHNNYWIWGPRGYTGDVLILVGDVCGGKGSKFRTGVRAATFTARWVMPYENHLPISICRGIREPIAQLWPSLKNYI